MRRCPRGRACSRIDDRWFTWRFAEPTPDKESPTFYAVHETDEGEPDAYAVYKVKHHWPGEIPRNKLVVNELIAATPQATADIWRFVFDVDLVERVRATDRPADDPLLHLAVEPRHLGYSLRDGMYVRLVDVPAALEARGYAGDGSLVLEVSDAFCPWNEGRHELTVADGSATCRPTERGARTRLRRERARRRLSRRQHVRRARRGRPGSGANGRLRGPCRHHVPVGAGTLVLPAVLSASAGQRHVTCGSPDGGAPNDVLMPTAPDAFMGEPTLHGSATTGQEATHGSMGTSERSDGRGRRGAPRVEAVAPRQPLTVRARIAASP